MTAVESARGSQPRDLVVIGASAGGVAALQEIVRLLPEHMPAAMLVAVHVTPTHRSVLPEILNRGRRPIASHPRDLQHLERGHLYVAPPDRHLVVSDGTMRLLRSPRENHHRPAIDPLFRSAARTYGPRTIGVILSGTLDDGAAGMRAIKDAGGVCIVQDPEEAAFRDMPTSALLATDVDYCVPVSRIAGLLIELTTSEAGPMTTPQSEQDDEMTAEHLILPEQTAGDGAVAFGCPDCGGVLRQVESSVLHYQCRVGHRFSGEALLAAQASGIEDALWTAVRAMEEGADVARRLARRSERNARPDWTDKYAARVTELMKSAGVLRDILAGANGASPSSSEEPSDPASE